MMKILRYKLIVLLFLVMGVSVAHSQCITILWEMSMPELYSKPNTNLSLPVMVDFSEVFDGVGYVELVIQFDPELLEFNGVSEVDEAVRGINVTPAGAGRVVLLWNRSPFQSLFPTNLVGKLLKLNFFYKGGLAPVVFEEVIIRDVYTNPRMGLTTNGLVREVPGYTVTLQSDPVNAGVVFTGGGTYYSNDQVSVSASEPFNYRFVRWNSNLPLLNLLPSHEALEVSFVMPERDVILTAVYEKIHDDPVVLNLAFEGTGEVQIGENTYSSADGQRMLLFNRGDLVTLKALGSEQWQFDRWLGDNTGTDPEIIVVMGWNQTIRARFVRIQYRMLLDIQGEGSVLVNGVPYSGAGPHSVLYNQSTPISLTQSASEGWQFARWTGTVFSDGISTQPSENFNLTAGTIYVTATFEPLPEMAALTLNITGSGQVFVNEVAASGTVEFPVGTEVTLRAEADDSWEFDAWEGGWFSGSNLQISILMNADQEVTARFVPLFTLTLQVSHEEAGIVTGGEGRYREGTVVNITASTPDRYVFDSWTGNPADMALPDAPGSTQTSLIMPARNVSLTASFTRLYELTFNVDMEYVDGLNHPLVFDVGTDEVYLLGDFPGWNQSGSTPEGYILLTRAGESTLYTGSILVPAGDYQYRYFLNDAASGAEWPDNSLRTVGVKDKDVELFDWFGSWTEPERKFVVHAAAGPNGSISPAGPIVVTQNDDLLIEFIADEGYHIAEVVVDGASQGTPDRFLFENITGNHDIQVYFSINTYSLSYSGGANGHIEGQALQEVAHGSDASPVLAVAGEGYLFIRWSDGLTDNPRTDAFVTADLSVAAEYGIMTYTLSLTADAGGSISPTGTYTVMHGDNLEVEIMPHTGYHVQDVLLDGVSAGAVSSLPLINISGNHSVHVQFAINTYTVSVTYGEHGKVEPGGELTVEHGGSIDLEIIPDKGWHVADVLLDGISQGATESLIISNIKQHHEVYVVFAITTYVLEFDIRDAATGEIIPDAHIVLNENSYPAGDYVFMEVLPETYYYTISREGYFSVSDSLIVDEEDLFVVVQLAIDNTQVAETLQTEWRVWPNPAADILWVAFTSQSQQGLEVVLYDMQGKQLRQIPVYERGDISISMNLQGLTSGVYLLRIIGDQPFPARQVLVK